MERFSASRMLDMLKVVGNADEADYCRYERGPFRPRAVTSCDFKECAKMMRVQQVDF